MPTQEPTRRTAPTNPPCSKCEQPMHVILVMPDPSNESEKRLFKCNACGNEETITVKYK